MDYKELKETLKKQPYYLWTDKQREKVFAYKFEKWLEEKNNQFSEKISD